MTEPVKPVNAREGRLLDAAARLFARFGFDKTSVDDIARSAGVSKGAVYLHWPSKLSLFEAVLIREAFGLFDEILNRLDGDPEGGTLGSIYRHSIQALGSNPLLLAAYTVDAAVLGEYVRHQEPELYARRLLFGEAFIRRMQAANLMRRELQPEMTGTVLGVISFGLLSLSQLGASTRAPALDTLAESLADLLERGIGTGDRQAAAAGKEAFRILVAETRELYAQRIESTNGQQHR